MGRPREFDTTDALDRATRVFWSKGYEATSLNDLIDAMGISKSSFYETFGSKHDLFLSTLDRYAGTTFLGLVDALEGDLPGRDAITQVFEHNANRFIHQSEPLGCFASNSSAEMVPHCAQTRDKVRAIFTRAEEAFAAAIRRGQGDGSIAARHDPQALARFMVASMNGLQVMGKANSDPQTLRDVVKTVLAALD